MSGGTGGVSVFTYNTDTGVLQSNASIRNQDLGDIGYPDVTLVTPKLAALSTDVRNEATSFGVTMANIDLSQSTLSRRQFFPVEDTVGFNYAIGPANFPCTSSVYTQNGESYLYVANGPLTVQEGTSRPLYCAPKFLAPFVRLCPVVSGWSGYRTGHNRLRINMSTRLAWLGDQS